MQHFHCAYHPQPSGLMERTNGTIKIQLAKLSEAFNPSWPKALLLLSLSSMPFGKHRLSPLEIITERPMQFDKEMCEPTLLKGDILHYCQGLIVAPKRNEKLVANSFHTKLPGEEDLKDHGVQPGDFVYWKRHLSKDSLQPR